MPLKYEPVYPIWVIVLFLLIHIHAHRDCISCCLLIFTSSSSKPQFLVQIQNYLIKTMTSIRMAQTKNNNKYLICNNKNKVTSAHKNEKKTPIQLSFSSFIFFIIFCPFSTPSAKVVRASRDAKKHLQSPLSLANHCLVNKAADRYVWQQTVAVKSVTR